MKSGKVKVTVTLARVALRRKSFTSVSKEQYEERKMELRQLFEEFCSVLLYGKWGQRIRAVSGERYGAKGGFGSKSKNI